MLEIVEAYLFLMMARFSSATPGNENGVDDPSRLRESG